MKKIITAIEPQKKNLNRFNIFLDGEFAFGISKSLGVQIKPGDHLGGDTIEELREKDEFALAWQRALQFLNYRSRTEQELIDKLEKLGFKEKIVNQVVNECKEKDYINDQNFAEQWVETRTQNAPRSQSFMAFELKRKKISENTINKALSNSISDEELAMAASKKFWRRLITYEVEVKKAKLQGHLLRRGFSYDVIREVIKKMIEISETGNTSLSEEIKWK